MSQSSPRPIFVLPETRAIAVLGCFDLLATIYLIATHRAQEGNGVANDILMHYGAAGFAFFKALMLAVPLVIAEFARHKSPIFVPRALRVGLVAYVLLLLFAYKDPLIALVQGHAVPVARPHHRETAVARLSGS
ncbi:MAG TPA: DUF5658 family protein [Chthonomonadaceae bacterium]|nr:DUF5658 family protein [Chthonomonadaceae bacterium]